MFATYTRRCKKWLWLNGGRKGLEYSGKWEKLNVVAAQACEVHTTFCRFG